ncbi:MAG: HEPN domain-containing protein [Planctomycetota bacterium]
MPFGYNDCINKGLLRKIPPSKQQSERSLEKAGKWLLEVARSLEGQAYHSAVLTSYLAMFHSARAILFRDGFREKSHFCIARYLEEHYAKKRLLENKWIELLDHYRELRHNDQYDLSFMATEEEARNALASARDFVERMALLLKDTNR